MLPFSIPWKHQKTNISNLPQLQDIQFTLSFVNHCGFQRNFFLALLEKLNLGLHQPFEARIDYISWLVLQTFVVITLIRAVRKSLPNVHEFCCKKS